MNNLPLISRFSAIQSILCSVTLFALANIIVKNLVRIPTVEVVYFRSLFILLVTFFLIRKKEISIFKHPHQKKLWLRGLAGTLGLYLLFWTIQNMPLSSAITLHYLSPILTVLLSALFLKEKISKLQFLALSISLIGVGIVKEFDPSVTLWQVTIALVAALFAAIAYTTIRSLKGKADPLLIVFYFPLVTIPLFSYPLYLEWVWPSLWELGQLTLVGVLTFVAQLFLTKAYTEGEVKKIAPFNYLGIFYAIIFSVTLFGEELNQQMLFGFLLVLIGVWWSKRLT